MLLNGFNRVVNYDSLSANFRKLESLLKTVSQYEAKTLRPWSILFGIQE